MIQCKTSKAISGMGHSMKRKEDDRFIQGKGHYVDDIKLPGMLYMDIVRSPYAYAKIVKIDTEAAMKVPGVVAVVERAAGRDDLDVFAVGDANGGMLFTHVATYEAPLAVRVMLAGTTPLRVAPRGCGRCCAGSTPAAHDGGRGCAPERGRTENTMTLRISTPTLFSSFARCARWSRTSQSGIPTWLDR